jgi:hypothetical protein
MEAVSSFAHSETASLLQSGPGLQYELRLANRMKSQLLISHRLFTHPTQIAGLKKQKENQAIFREYPPFFWGYLINFCFNA